MKRMFAYTRVSTTRQGNGSSLTEQREAIESFSQRNNYTIVEWFSEQETAAKQGRREFSRMIALLQKGKVDGVIFHKLDRGTRNPQDWVDIGQLIDSGCLVKFAHENIDVSQRGGRITADVLAAISADYIRNLKEERDKGFYGRLKQGIYPLRAPVGYIDCGGGKLKTIDPVSGPLTKNAFELYSSGHYSLDSLCTIMHERGLRSLRGGRLKKQGMSRILRNPFYAGIMRINTTKETFPGKHEQLISMALFEQVQGVLDGNYYPQAKSHKFLFRKFFTCHHCNKTLVGEQQKGRIYYRCQTKDCPTKTVREDRLNFQIEQLLSRCTISDDQLNILLQRISSNNEIDEKQNQLISQLQLQLSNMNERLDRLTDAYLDGVLDKDTLINKKENILKKITGLRDQLADLTSSRELLRHTMTEKLELLKSPETVYKLGTQAQKSELLNKLSSNSQICGRKALFKLKSPLDKLFSEPSVPLCAHHRSDLRIQDGHCVSIDSIPILEKLSDDETIEFIWTTLLNHRTTSTESGKSAI